MARRTMEERIADAVLSKIASCIATAVEVVLVAVVAYFAGDWVASFSERPLPLGMLSVAIFFAGLFLGWFLRGWSEVHRDPIWDAICGLSGEALAVVKDAYPDGTDCDDASGVRWHAAQMLAEAGIVRSTEGGCVDMGHCMLTSEAMSSIKRNYKKFQNLE